MTDLTFKLTERDFNALSSGQTVTRNYKLGDKVFLIVVWNRIKRKIKRKTQSAFSHRDVFVANIGLTSREIETILAGNSLTVNYLAMDITICT